MGGFETELLAIDENLAALANLRGTWIDRVHERKPPKVIMLDMDGSAFLRVLALSPMMAVGILRDRYRWLAAWMGTS